MNKRKNYSATFKAKVALDAIKGDLTLPELSQKYDVHPNLIHSLMIDQVYLNLFFSTY
jgi:transposase